MLLGLKGTIVNVLIRGAGFRNKGAEAMLLTVQREISRRLRSVSFAALISPWDVERCKSVGISPMVRKNKGTVFKLSVLRECLFRDPRIIPVAIDSPNSANQMMCISTSDAVLDISGYAWLGKGPTKSARRILKYCKKRNKTFIFLPQAWGPFSNSKAAKDIREVCENSTMVYARDRKSLSYLMSLCSSGSVHTEIVPDIAFKFKGERPEMGAGILAEKGLDVLESKMVGIVPNTQIYRRMPGKGGNNEYVRIMVDVAKYCLQRLRASVVLIPHEIAQGIDPKPDDRQLCDLIQSGSETNGRCLSISDNVSAAEIKSVIGHLELLIGCRYHSLVAAISNRIPAIAIGWSHKYLGLLDLFGLSEYSLDFSKLCQSGLYDKLNKAWHQREEIMNKIEGHLPRIEKQVDRMFDNVVQMMGLY